MANEVFNIFTGLALANQITLTDGFTKCNYLYMVFQQPNVEIEVDISLQIYLTPAITRAVRLENDNVLNTVSITLIPHELAFSPYNMRVAIITSEDVLISITAVRTECCGEQVLSDIKSQLNRIEAYSVIGGIADIGTAIASGFTAFLVAETALPLLASNLLREGFSILLPAVAGLLGESAQILFNGAPQLLLQAGQFYVDETGFTGAVSAFSSSGTPINLAVREFT